MRGNIFISYRRDDDPGFAHATYGQLEAAFGAERLFMDVEGHIKPGDDFVKVLSDQVAACDVLLAIIGEGWLDAKDADGNRRLEKADDFVRIEITSALANGKRVIPVLVGDADMPRADELPASLKPLARRNAVAIRPTRFRADVQGLINALKEGLEATEVERTARTETERKAAEIERRQREAEETARLKQLEQLAAEKARAGLGREEIRKAEELANWDFIKDSTSQDEFRNHIARFEGGTTGRYARAKLEALMWADPALWGNIPALQQFLAEFPQSANARAASAELDRMETEERVRRAADERRRQETEEWSAVALSTDQAVIEGFLKTWPDGQHAEHARLRLGELRSGGVTRRGLLRIAGTAAAGTAAGGALWYLAQPGSWRRIHSFAGHPSGVNSVAFSPDGRFALSGSDDNTLTLWDVRTAKALRSFAGHSSGVTSVAFSPDGRFALSGSFDNTLALWDVGTAKTLRKFTGHSGWVNSVAFSPDGRFALSGSSDNTLTLWDVGTAGTLRKFTGHSSGVTSVAFSPDGRFALSGSYDSTLTLWDVGTATALHKFTGDFGWVNSVAFSPDGRFALSGSGGSAGVYDFTLKLWDVSEWTQAR